MLVEREPETHRHWIQGVRTVGASAVALGIAQGAHDLAVNYMCQREAFGQRLKDFQGLEWMMAESEMKLDAARLLIYRAALRKPSST